ncbi:Protein N-acetyltransferase, RimJ/RimL family [Salinihabitans flavidus]|uniref:Protein N-acetyltransferase, RimJ/RimL family n=1 Tax=Salinihabitans flavidus TaxID=569882 RepID=A0A1H8L8H4_9RHOB|nr:GNAT family N-acetyltransferase [Salinihabitans flavidus]SEO01096.1 Protein N-acetyltransferase, RimJ/RimL family [Salinihabitans flavidus]
MTLTPAPIIETERLILRGPEPQDFEPIAAFYADADRSWGFDGPLPRHEAWRWFAGSIGHWHLHGYGFWTVTLKETGGIAGIAGIWNPEGWPEPELGWVVFDGFEGRGIAYEAALAARNHAYGPLGFTTMTSNIVPGNTRSEQLARRLGAWLEKTYTNVTMGTDQLFRHPGPETL